MRKRNNAVFNFGDGASSKSEALTESWMLLGHSLYSHGGGVDVDVVGVVHWPVESYEAVAHH